MPSASALRQQIEAALAHRIPSALSPAPRLLRPVAPTGIASVDLLLDGGLPLGTITEMVGPESSGRTSLALSFVQEITQAGRVCAWIDVSDTLHPESAAALGVYLQRLLWIRCGVTRAPAPSPTPAFALPGEYLAPRPIPKGLHGGGHGPHPRTEIKGMSAAVGGFLHGSAPHPAPSPTPPSVPAAPSTPAPARPQRDPLRRPGTPPRPWARIDQALRVTDLLLQAGGFSALVLDLGSIAPEFSSRVPLATWFRYRAAAERTQAAFLLLTQHPSARSSAGLVLHLDPAAPLTAEPTVFSGLEHRIGVERERFAPLPANVIPLRKPPQREQAATWRSRALWAGSR